MKALVLASVAALAFAGAAQATQIAAFGQTSGSNVLFATANAAQTVTAFAITNATVNVTQLFDSTPLDGVDFSLAASSIDAASTVGGAVLQHYSGHFCITSAAGCGGTNILSGTFSDAAFGALGGTGLVVNVSNPPDSLTLSSGVIPAADLIPPNSFNLGLSNVTPALAILGSTIAPFSASVAGTASSSVRAVAEPSSLAALASGLFLLGFAMRAWRPGRRDA